MNVHVHVGTQEPTSTNSEAFGSTLSHSPSGPGDEVSSVEGVYPAPSEATPIQTPTNTSSVPRRRQHNLGEQTQTLPHSSSQSRRSSTRGETAPAQKPTHEASKPRTHYAALRQQRSSSPASVSTMTHSLSRTSLEDPSSSVGHVDGDSQVSQSHRDEENLSGESFSHYLENELDSDQLPETSAALQSSLQDVSGSARPAALQEIHRGSQPEDRRDDSHPTFNGQTRLNPTASRTRVHLATDENGSTLVGRNINSMMASSNDRNQNQITETDHSRTNAAVVGPDINTHPLRFQTAVNRNETPIVSLIDINESSYLRLNLPINIPCQITSCFLLVVLAMGIYHFCLYIHIIFYFL